MTVDRMGDWAMIVEGANTYSPDPVRRAARMRMERAVYWQPGTVIASDFLVNSGGVIFAAQEHLIKTPPICASPTALLGDRAAVERWLDEHQAELAELAERRLEAGIRQREEVIRRNMKELVDLLVADPDLLPIEAAEQISINRIAARERYRRIAEIMEPLPTIAPDRTLREAAQLLIADPNEMLAVVAEMANWLASSPTGTSPKRRPPPAPMSLGVRNHDPRRSSPPAPKTTSWTYCARWRPTKSRPCRWWTAALWSAWSAAMCWRTRRCSAVAGARVMPSATHLAASWACLRRTSNGVSREQARFHQTPILSPGCWNPTRTTRPSAISL